MNFQALQYCTYFFIIQMQSNSHYPYILVGAGISSLQAALILAEHKQSFLILEASDRIGGRICSLTLGQVLASDPRNQKAWLQEAKSDPIQCGGTWICQDNHIMLQYVKRYGLTTTQQFYDGKHVLAETHQNYVQYDSLGEYYEKYKDKILKLFLTMEKIQEKVSELSGKKEQNNITPEQQAELRNIYKEYDNVSAYDFMLAEVGDEILAKLLNKQASTLQCCDSKDYSVFSLIQGQPLANVKFYVGAQEANIDGFRLKEGMSSIYGNIKADIQKLFDSQGQGKKIDELIKLNSPVIEIKNGKVPVEVTTNNNQKYTCDKVVMGLPLGTFSKIKIEELSAGKRLVTENQVTCNMTRMPMIFKQPFWRKKFAGYVSFSHNFAMNEIVDLTPQSQNYGILAFVFTSNGFEEWNKAVAAECEHSQGPQFERQWYQVNQRKALKIVADIYLNGDINSPHLKDVPIFAKSLSDYPYIKSTYQSTTAVTIADRVYQAGDDINKCFTRDETNMIILGSDFSDEFAGYMEGAIRIARKKMYAQCKSKDPLEHLTEVKGFQATSTSTTD